MSCLTLKCVDQSLQITETPLISSGSVNFVRVNFTFDSTWDGVTKTAIFYRSKDEVYYQLLDEGNSCIIPNEVLTSDGKIYIGVFGNWSNITKTTEIVSYQIVEGAITEGIITPDPTPDIYSQLISKFNEYDIDITEKIAELNNKYDSVNFDLTLYSADIDPTSTPTLPLVDAEKLGGHGPNDFILDSNGVANAYTYKGLSIRTWYYEKLHLFRVRIAGTLVEALSTKAGYVTLCETGFTLPAEVLKYIFFNSSVRGQFRITGGAIKLGYTKSLADNNTTTDIASGNAIYIDEFIVIS